MDINYAPDIILNGSRRGYNLNAERNGMIARIASTPW
jgi:hypothetical protein